MKEDYYGSNTENFPIEETQEADSDNEVILRFRNGITFTKRQVPRILRYVNYNKDKDQDNYF